MCTVANIIPQKFEDLDPVIQSTYKEWFLSLGTRKNVIRSSVYKLYKEHFKMFFIGNLSNTPEYLIPIADSLYDLKDSQRVAMSLCFNIIEHYYYK